MNFHIIYLLMLIFFLIVPVAAFQSYVIYLFIKYDREFRFRLKTTRKVLLVDADNPQCPEPMSRRYKRVHKPFLIGTGIGVSIFLIIALLENYM